MSEEKERPPGSAASPQDDVGAALRTTFAQNAQELAVAIHQVTTNPELADAAKAIAATMQNVAASVQPILRQWQQRAAELGRAWREPLLNALPHLQQMAKAFEYWEEHGPADLKAAFGDAGYLASGRLSLPELADVIRAHREGGSQAALAKIEELYDELFSNPAFLGQLRDDWFAHPTFKNRERILSDALTAHSDGLYGASVPALFAQAEGIVANLCAHEGPMGGKKYEQNITKLSAEDRWTGELFLQFVSDILLARFYHGDRIPAFSRHAILHGGDVGYATESNSRRAILLVDHLWHIGARQAQ